MAEAVGDALGRRGATVAGVGPWQPLDDRATDADPGFDEALHTLGRVASALGGLDLLVVLHPSWRSAVPPDWRRALTDHRRVTGDVLVHAAWGRAGFLVGSPTSLRVVHVVPAGDPAGATTAQAVAQMARSTPMAARPGSVHACAIALESDAPEDVAALGHLVAAVAFTESPAELAGAELAVGPGWAGIRSHPRASFTLSFAGPALPAWVDPVLRGTLP